MKSSFVSSRRLLFIAASLGTAPIWAQSPPDVALEEVVVTGQAVPGAVLGDIPPENTLTQRDIRAYGVGTVSELLDEIALQTTSGQSRDGGGPVVLVNGRRISGVNEVGDLPTEAVLRVDILPEEVALKYGYSSDQKVVNIILRRRFNAVTGETAAGGSTDGGGGQFRGNATMTRIRENQRLNIAGNAQLQDPITEEQRGITPATDGPGGDEAYRTLQPDRQNYGVNAVFASPLGKTITASTNLTANHTISHSENGLSFSDPLDPLDREATSTTVHLGTALNMDLPDSWRMSLVGAYDHGDSRNDTERNSLVADGGVVNNAARSKSDALDVSLLATRKLFALPAGNLLLSLQAGAQSSRNSSGSAGTVTASTQSLSRTTSNARVSLDLPLTKRGGFGGGIGSLTANVNAGVTDVSDFDTLVTAGYGLNWSPTTALSLIAAASEDRRAPSAAQLVNPLVTNVGVSVYDYATGESVLVTQTSGGNPGLLADDRRTFKLGGTLKPFANHNFSVTANYSESRTKNGVQSLSGISAPLEAAFPIRYVRDEDGELVLIDTRPVNFASAERSSLRWGFNLTQVLREPKRPQFGNRPRPPRPPSAAPSVEASTKPTPPDAPPGTSPDASAGGPPVPAGADPTGQTDSSLDEVVVNGRPENGNGGPPVDRGGFGGRRGGFGGGAGPGGFGPPGGFNGGRRGGPGGFGGPRGDSGTQLQLSIYHTWLFTDRVTLRQGLAPIDLLDGGSLGGTPAPRQQVQMNGGITDNGIGVRLTGEWRSSGRVIDSQGYLDDLHFSSLGTLSLRMFADLGQRLPTKQWARGVRLTFAVQNLFNERQKVTNDAGEVPQAYQAGYLDPAGRTLLLSVRMIR